MLASNQSRIIYSMHSLLAFSQGLCLLRATMLKVVTVDEGRT